MSLRISAKGKDQFSGITDETGKVVVRSLPLGDYWLNGEFLGTGVIYTCFHVNGKPSRGAKGRLRYSWGDQALATQEIAGRLVDSQPARGGTPIWNLTHSIDVPITGAGLTLHDPTTHAVYKTVSDQNGRFSFGGLPEGTYVLHVEGGGAGDRAYDPTDSVVELSSSAKRRELLFKGGPIKGGPNGCGAEGLGLDLLDGARAWSPL